MKIIVKVLAISIKNLKERVFKTIDEISEEIIKIGEEIRRTPELGFKEVRTSSIVKREFEKLELDYEDGLALTGVKATILTQYTIWRLYFRPLGRKTLS